MNRQTTQLRFVFQCPGLFFAQFTSGNRQAGLYNGRAQLSRAYVEARGLSSVVEVNGAGNQIRRMPVVLRQKGEHELKLSFEQPGGDYRSFVFERVRSVSGQPVRVHELHECEDECSLLSPMLCDFSALHSSSCSAVGVFGCG
uniref:Uncharacterized protein n=1 Tax=Vitrella brassicaformis TaxID=1169539 RepID=A0A7S1P6R3_9ALVE|mmetsp:Transcript_40863/g.102125  ORF Transcript_40863/g.102125 Transcript_40863/m.102125 type:complete len:143 (+) Transcript_40863:927-1355(+)